MREGDLDFTLYTYDDNALFSTVKFKFTGFKKVPGILDEYMNYTLEYDPTSDLINYKQVKNASDEFNTNPAREIPSAVEPKARESHAGGRRRFYTRKSKKHMKSKHSKRSKRSHRTRKH